MKNDKQLQAWYLGEINNRKVVHQDVELKVPKGHASRSFFAFTLLCLKIFLAKFTRPRAVAPVVGLSWSNTHTVRLSDVSDAFPVIRFKAYEVNKEEVLLCKGVRLRQVFLNIKQLRPLPRIGKGDAYDFDCFWYRALFATEAAWMGQLCRGREKVYIGGLNDRYSILICAICSELDTDVVMVQHGLLSDREGLYRPEVKAFGYQFDFSKDFIPYSVKASSVFSAPSKSTSAFSPISSITSDGIDKWVAVVFDYASPDINKEIVEAVLAATPKNVGVLAYVHPVESKAGIYYFEDNRVRLEDSQRYSDPWMVVGQGSTLIAEYADAGGVENIVLLNLKNGRADLFKTSQNTVLASIDELAPLLRNSQ